MRKKMVLRQILEIYYQQECMVQISYGKKLVALLYDKISNEANHTQEIRNQIKNNFANIILSELNISSNDYHFYMCLGSIVKDSIYDRINDIERQLGDLIKVFLSKRMNKNNLNTTWKNQSKESYTHQRNIYASQSFNNYKKALNNNHSFSTQTKQQETRAYQDSQNKDSDDDQEQDDQGDQEQDEQITQQYLLSLLTQSFHSNQKGKQKKNQPKKSDSSQFEGFLRSKGSAQKRSFIQKMELIPFETEQYLENVKNCSSEFSLLVQKFQKLKMKMGQWQQSMKDGYQIQVVSVTVPGILTIEGNDVIVKGYGKALNKKDAKSLASRDILQKIYGRFPHLLKEMKNIKKKQSIET